MSDIFEIRDKTTTKCACAICTKEIEEWEDRLIANLGNPSDQPVAQYHLRCFRKKYKQTIRTLRGRKC